MTRPPSTVAWLTSPLILLAGAGLYALAEGPGGVTFFLTPLVVGIIAVLAGALGSHRHLIPAGLGIAGWGVAPRAERGNWTHSAGVAVVTAGIGYFVAFSISSLGRWPAWALSLVAWAIWEALQPLIRPATAPPRRAVVAG